MIRPYKRFDGIVYLQLFSNDLHADHNINYACFSFVANPMFEANYCYSIWEPLIVMVSLYNVLYIITITASLYTMLCTTMYWLPKIIIVQEASSIERQQKLNFCNSRSN
jgi:hypothetical protein